MTPWKTDVQNGEVEIEEKTHHTMLCACKMQSYQSWKIQSYQSCIIHFQAQQRTAQIGRNDDASNFKEHWFITALTAFVTLHAVADTKASRPPQRSRLQSTPKRGIMCCTSIITAGQLARTAARPAPNGLQQAGTSKSRDLTPALLRCQTRRNLPADQRKPSSIACQSPRRFSSRASAAPAVPETQSQCLWQVTGDPVPVPLAGDR